MREYATLLAVNLRKESLEQQDTAVLQRKLDDMESKLSRLEAAEGECHSHSYARSSFKVERLVDTLPILLWLIRDARSPL